MIRSDYIDKKTQKHLITNDDEECNAGAEAIHLNTKLSFCNWEWLGFPILMINGWVFLL